MSPLAVLDRAQAAGRPALDEASGKAVLAAFGIPVPVFRVFETPEGLAKAMHELKTPVVLKVLTAEGVHKSDVGGIAISLNSTEDAMAALEVMQRRLTENDVVPAGWMVEEMALPGVEIVVGGVVDPLFGPMVMVGLGGVFIEILKDVAVRICPIDRRDAVEMIEALRGAPLLHGARGRPKVRIESVIDVLMQIGGAQGLMMQRADAIAELDINPLIAGPHGACAVDVRIILQTSADGGAV